MAAALLFLGVPALGTAATFQTSIDQCQWVILPGVFSGTSCPLPMDVFASADGIIGYEKENQGTLLRAGAWAFTPSNLTRRARFILDYGAVIQPGPGEQVGDPVDVYFCSKIYVRDDGVDTTYDGAAHIMRVIRASTIWSQTIERATTLGDRGWFRDEDIQPNVEVRIGDTIRLDVTGQASGLGRATADSRLQASLTPGGCPDPPIAGTPVPSLAPFAVVLAAFALARLGGVRTLRRQSAS
ncbi:MAG: hypothetical protein AAF430_25150 [Myxococcota bacterium]